MGYHKIWNWHGGLPPRTSSSTIPMKATRPPWRVPTQCILAWNRNHIIHGIENWEMLENDFWEVCIYKYIKYIHNIYNILFHSWRSPRFFPRWPKVGSEFFFDGQQSWQLISIKTWWVYPTHYPVRLFWASLGPQMQQFTGYLLGLSRKRREKPYFLECSDLQGIYIYIYIYIYDRETFRYHFVPVNSDNFESHLDNWEDLKN